MSFHSKKLSGFTNIEMLIVIVMVIGLAALAINTFQRNSFIPRDDLRKKDLQGLVRSIGEFQRDSGAIFDPYPGEKCLGNNSYKAISTRNTTFRDALKNYPDAVNLNLTRENYIYIISCNLEDFAFATSLNVTSEFVSSKSFLDDFLATLPQSRKKNTFIVTR